MILVDKLLGIVDKVLERSNITKAREPVERVRKHRLQILEERRKGDMADQAKIAALYQELSVDIDALEAIITTTDPS